jgi:hypothetical protein
MAPMASITPKAEPPWRQVLATTVELWLARQRRAAAGFLRTSGARARSRLRRSGGHLVRLAARRWRLAAILLALAIAAAVVPAFASGFTGTSSPAARVPASGATHAPSRALPATATAQTEAAAWITGQVASDAIVGCYPAMCAALQAHGVIAGLLLPLGPGSAGPLAADVIVTSASAGSQLADEYAPDVIASFGSGDARIEVRVIARNGAASYESALRADLTARKSAGSQLLRNNRLHFSPQAAAQIRRGEVDSRLLATIAALSSQYSFQVTAFDDASPGARTTLFREVTITKNGRNGSAELTKVLALVNAQERPYLPDHAVIIRIAGGHAALRVAFAAPSPLGLLTTVLDASTERS